MPDLDRDHASDHRVGDNLYQETSDRACSHCEPGTSERLVQVHGSFEEEQINKLLSIQGRLLLSCSREWRQSNHSLWPLALPVFPCRITLV